MLNDLLKEHHIKPSQVIKFDLDKALKLDLSKDNQVLSTIDVNDEDEFTQFIFDQLASADAEVGWGGYGENRGLYARSDLFSDEEARTLHLGIDIWAKAGTPVYAPLEGKVHSFNNLAVHGDYGPVIILEHAIGGATLYSLYGHLAQRSLEGLRVGQWIKQGELFAWLGEYGENYHWPPHLHFQLMWDLQGHSGDYPGVAKLSQRQEFLDNCPDPEAWVFSVD